MAPKSPFIVAARELVHPRDEPGYGSPGRPAWLDVDWAAVTHRMAVEAAGGEVEYVDLGPRDAAAIIWIHGLGASWQTWLENLPYFAGSHRCIAMDLPGFGRSGAMRGEVSIERYGKVVDELVGRLGVRRAAVVGNSMGGFIATEVALRFPTVVDRLVLVSAAVLWQEYRRAKPLVALAQATDAVGGRRRVESTPRVERRPKLRAATLAFGGFHLPHLLSRELQLELVRTVRRTDGFLPALRALASYPLRDELADVQAPTLIVWGTHDTL